jgi:threonine-phosphate decarboxylase
MPWRVNSIASAASCAALKDGVFLEETRSRIREWRQEMSLQLEASGRLRAYPSSTNFLLLKILDEGYDSGRLCDELGMREILIRNCANFAGLDARFVRVSVQKPELNARLIEAMGEVWK